MDALTPMPSYEVRRHTTSSRIAMPFLLLIVIAIPTMPLWATGGQIRWMVELSCLIAITQMWNLLAGYGGLVSVGQQAFIGAGGYGLYVLALKFGVNPFLSIPISVVVPTIIAVPSYLLLRRLDGAYFSIGTWVVAEVLRLLTSNLPYLNAGAGMSLSVMGHYSPHEREVALAIICPILLFVTVGGTYALLRSRHGLALTAMRDDAIAAESQGVNVKRLRFLVFVLTAAGSGLAGAVYYMAQLRITPASGFDPYWASVCIFSVVVGGIGRIEGAIIGSLLYFFATRFLSEYGATYLIVLGFLTLLIALFAPVGLWGLFTRARDWPWFPVSRRLVESRTRLASA